MKKKLSASKNDIHKSGEHKSCPVFLTLGLLGNKWAIRLLDALMNAKKNTQRFSELQKTLTGISQRELSKQLREFEAAGIVKRTVYPQIPPKVEYTLTSLGASLSKPISALSNWAEEHGAKVQKNRLASSTKM